MVLHYHARVRAYLPRQLRIADVNGIHPSRSTLQKTIREPTRRRADVQPDLACYVYAEVSQRRIELHSCAADERHHRQQLDMSRVPKHVDESLDVVLEQRRHEVIIRPRQHLRDMIYEGEQRLSA